MPLRNGPHGYGAVTKTLHWLTVLAIAAQFVVGYTMDDDSGVRDSDCDPVGEERSGGDTSDPEEERLDRIEEQCEQRQDAREDAADNPVATAYDDLGSGDIATGGLTLPEGHILLGILILILGIARVTWRALTPLPPWSDALSRGQQRFVALTEKVLLGLLFAVPLSGLALAVGSDDLVPLHIAAHVAFFVTLAAHLSITLRPRILPRMT